jgi:hypothetical protein
MANERDPNWTSDEPVRDINEEDIAGRADEGDDEFEDVDEMDEDDEAEDLE